MAEPGLPLVGAQVVVRRFVAGDAPAFRRYRDDPQTASLQGWEVPYTAAQAEAFVAWAAGAPLCVPGEWCQLAVERHDRAGLIGDVGVHTLATRAATVELGVTLAPEARGQGLATEAITLVLDHVAAAHGVEHAVAWLAAENRASAAMFERLGFALVATEPASDGVLEHCYERTLAAG